MNKLEKTVPSHAAPETAERALQRLFPELPARLFRAAFRNRDVKRNGVRVPAHAIVKAGDVLCVYAPNPPALSVVHEDEAYLIIDKSQGMPAVGPGSVEEQLGRERGVPVYACHRLDVMTGGLLLLAKTPAARERAEEAFARRELTKTYRALVRGCPATGEATLRAYLVKDAEKARVRVLDRLVPGALPIETRYRVVTPGDLSRLEIGLVTGRTHQIRAHLAHIGHPVLGDDRYGDRAFNRSHGARRQRLWATGLILWDGRAFRVQEPF